MAEGADGVLCASTCVPFGLCRLVRVPDVSRDDCLYNKRALEVPPGDHGWGSVMKRVCAGALTRATA